MRENREEVPLWARWEMMMMAWSEEVRVEMEKKKKKCPVKFLELFSCHSLYLTTGQIGTQIYLMKSVIIHHMFIEHTQTLY